MMETKADRIEAKPLGDLLEGLGALPAERIASIPTPGTATEEDLLNQLDHEDRLYELVDGVLVEKAMGFFESRVAHILSHILESFLEEQDLGIVLGADATLRILPGQVRLPDVSFISWNQFPGRELPAEPVPHLAPDLAVEVISKSNTEAEMDRKLHDYFTAGVRLVWFAYPLTKTVKVYTHPEDFSLLTLDDTLDGGAILPGFRLSIREWFERAGRQRAE